MTETDLNPYLSVSEAAEWLCISRRTAYREIARGHLHVTVLGGRLFIASDEAARWARDRRGAA